MKIFDVARKVGYTLKKHSPAILTGVGVVGLGATAYYSYKAAPKVEAIVYDMEEDRKADIPVDRFEVARELMGATALPVLLGTGSIMAFGLSYYIQNSRIGALSAALTTLTAERAYFNHKYKEVHGEEAYNEFTRPEQTEQRTIVGEDGKGKTEEVQVAVDAQSLHGVWFDKSTEYAVDDHDYNMQYVRSVEDRLQTRLFRKGYLMLNEVYDMLGMERTKTGQLVGWTTGEGFNMSYDVSNMYSERHNMLLPQIYIKWNTPRYIYDKQNFEPGGAAL